MNIYTNDIDFLLLILFRHFQLFFSKILPYGLVTFACYYHHWTSLFLNQMFHYYLNYQDVFVHLSVNRTRNKEYSLRKLKIRFILVRETFKNNQ